MAKIQGPKRFRGETKVPGDKSITHRALILAALSEGEGRIIGSSPGDDNLRTLEALRLLGVEFEREEANLTIAGRGLKGLKEPDQVIDAGNSGTTMRLLTGLLAGQPFFSILTGDESLRKRPMGRVVEPLRRMGARIYGRAGGRLAPLAIDGHPLKGISYKMNVPSAQVKSALLLAGLMAEGETEIYEPVPCRDHTERLLSYLGADFSQEGGRLAVRGGGGWKGKVIEIPGDISSAALLIALGLIAPDSRVTIKGVGLNPTRTRFLDMLRAMGGKIEVVVSGMMGLEPVGDVTAETSPLKGLAIPPEEVPALIDEIPVLAVAASFAEGTTEIRGASELRVKESDRIRSLSLNLSRFGVQVEELEDGLRIRGGAGFKGCRVNSFGDHRIALAMLCMGALAKGETRVDSAGCVKVSYPGFFETINHLAL